MSHCPNCNVDLTPSEPAVGDVWLHVDDGVLYRVTETSDKKAWAGATRLWPPFNNDVGADPTRHSLAIWADHIRQGKWIKVTTPLDKTADRERTSAMTVSELIRHLRDLIDSGASSDSPVILEGYDLEGELIQADIIEAKTEARCEEDGELQAIYLMFDESPPESETPGGEA